MVQVNVTSGAAQKAGLGCMILFLLPFCAVGVGTGIGAVGSLISGDLLQAGFLTIFALVFGGAGFGLMGAAIVGNRRLKESARLRTEYPNEPWKWNPAWLSGRLESSSRTAMATAGAFAAFWNLIALPGAGLAMVEFSNTGDSVLLIVLLFPAVGIGLAVWALREAIRYRKFGVTQFEMAHVPGVIGRGVGGLLRTSRELRPDAGFEVTLVCVNRIVTGSGDDRNTRENTLWHEERTVRDFRPDPDGVGTMVPIAFRLPPDVRQTDDSEPRNQIIWRLKVSASVPGVDYAVAFDLPVYRTIESTTPLPEDDRDEEQIVEEAAADPAHQPPDSRIVVRTLAGRSEIYFPPARHPGPATGLTMFFLVWTAVVWFLLGSDAPLIFPMVFGFFDLLIGIAVFSLWFGVTRVVLRPDLIEVHRGLLFWQRTRRITPSDVNDIHTKVGMEVGDRPYYDLWIVTKNDGKVKAGSSVKNKREAEWLVATMQKAVEGP